jgi:hypothetical protein
MSCVSSYTGNDAVLVAGMMPNSIKSSTGTGCFRSLIKFSKKILSKCGASPGKLRELDSRRARVCASHRLTKSGSSFTECGGGGIQSAITSRLYSEHFTTPTSESEKK